MKFQTKYYDLDYEETAIRSIKCGNTEIIRMIFSAVRDQNWGTVLSKILNEKISQLKNGFVIETEMEYVQDEIKFNACYIIRGEQNQVSFEMRGKALSSFKKNRIGICVLHPIKECEGKNGKVIHADNSIETFTFPKQIAPHQPVKNIKQLCWKPGPGIDAQLTLEGDIFEMEDQRNWTDASYKTYCTPLELPFPVKIKKGEEFYQEVVLNLNTNRKIKPATNKKITFDWDNNSQINFPEIGLGASSRKRVMSEKEVKLLSEIQIRHLRTDIHLEEAIWQTEMNKAIVEARLLKVPLFLCLYFPDNYQSELNVFLEYFSGKQNLLKAILPVGLNHLSHPNFNEIAKAIRSRFSNVKVGTGVNAYFAELNRNRPDVSSADFISFTVCPQIHAFDETSIIENLEGLAEVVNSARELFPGVPVWVSPVTLKQRFNVVATTEEKYFGPEELAPQVDPRQSSMFSACWTLGAVKQLAQSGADLVDFYETVGWRGILNFAFSSELSKNIYPVFYLFRLLSNTKFIYSSISSHPNLVDGIVLKKNKSIEIVLANYTKETQHIQIPLIESALCFTLAEYPENPKELYDLKKIELQPNEMCIYQIS